MPKLAPRKITRKYNENLFLLDINQGLKETGIRMKLFTNYVSTQSLPNTHTTLERFLPSILESKCFNDENLSFDQEVKSTEIGHLFEHILLEYLSKLKSFYDNENIAFSGITTWDWTRDEHGVFHIKISAGAREAHIFEEALEKSIELVNKIVKTHLSSIN